MTRANALTGDALADAAEAALVEEDPHRFWNGEELRGRRLMLRSLHGFGDAVQMFRFLPRLRERVAELVVEVPPRLVGLAPHFAGMGEVITWGEDAPAVPPAWDAQMEVMELPYALRVCADLLEPTSGYLHVPELERQRVTDIMGPKRLPRVGVVWCAGHWNPARSVPFTEFRDLLKTEGVEFWSLQGDVERCAWSELGREAAGHDVYRCGDGILPLAAVVQQMDLVITVDTLAAHLAGALEVPCWVLLQRRADWRWMCGREDTPWYPSLRLFRQEKEGDWMHLLGHVRWSIEAWRDHSRFSEPAIAVSAKLESLT